MRGHEDHPQTRQKAQRDAHGAPAANAQAPRGEQNGKASTNDSRLGEDSARDFEYDDEFANGAGTEADSNNNAQVNAKTSAFAGVKTVAGQRADDIAVTGKTLMSEFAEALRHLWERPYSREVVVGGLLGLVFLVMIARLIYLQAFATGTLATSAKNERTARVKLPHRRGAIYDRNGNVLARSVDAVNIAAHPNMVNDVNATANLVASVLGGDAGSYAEKLALDTTFVYLMKRADPDVADYLREALTQTNAQRKELGLEELGGFEYEETSKRVYPLGEIAGNVIGVTGEDGHGLTGLELYYDDILSGSDGYLVQERGLYGSPVVGGQHEQIDPVDGENIVISIDIDIQRVAQEQLVQVIKTWDAGDGCVVVMQPETGELLACCSTPYLDPSNFATAEAAAFNLRCVSDSYEPGSTVKPCTASMAIDLGLATPDTTYWAPSHIYVGDDLVGDADSRNYEMDMSLRNMLERSSNVGAVLCAESVGKEQFATYLDRYHFGDYTGIDYPGEAMGLVRSYEEYTGAWTAMAFGQSFAVPPVQVARAIGCIANEGIILTPHFLLSRDGVPVDFGRGERVISTATAASVAEMMYSVTKNGYGFPGDVPGYRVSSKTGTSERAAETGGYLADQFTVSYISFAPTPDPKVLVYVLVDYVPQGSGSETAGGPAAVIMKEALTKLQIPPSL